MSGERIISGFDGNGGFHNVSKTFENAHVNSHLQDINENGEAGMSLPSDLMPTQDYFDLAVEEIVPEPIDHSVQQYIIDELASPDTGNPAGCDLGEALYEPNSSPFQEVANNNAINQNHDSEDNYYGDMPYGFSGPDKGPGCF